MQSSRSISADVNPMPLAGRRIVVTRAAEQAGELSYGLSLVGAEVISCPVIAFVPMSDPTSLYDRLQDLNLYDWIVFTSSNAVRFFSDALGDRPLPATLRLAVVGTSTAEAASSRLRAPDLVPDRFDAEQLLEALGALSVESSGETPGKSPGESPGGFPGESPGSSSGRGGMAGLRFLLAQAEEARLTLANGLETRGAHVDILPVYRTVAGNPSESALRDVRGGVDALTFTSPTTVVHFSDLLGADADSIGRHAAIFCIGPVTADAVRRLGWHVDAVAEPHTARGLVAAAIRHYQSTG